ncbi:hypothetical protein JTB14_027205 [Gonioctena quinquepunctata]|nr:hypothetical protein JTB14_027205 [Gonioctena quinquepunctata]
MWYWYQLNLLIQFNNNKRERINLDLMSMSSTTLVFPMGDLNVAGTPNSAMTIPMGKMLSMANSFHNSFESRSVLHNAVGAISLLQRIPPVTWGPCMCSCWDL